MLRILGFSILLVASFESSALADCGSNADCKGGRVCVRGQCVEPCSADWDCVGGLVCTKGECVPGCGRDKDCPGDQVCAKNHCVQCVSNAGCKGGTCADNACVAPAQAVDSAAIALPPPPPPPPMTAAEPLAPPPPPLLEPTPSAPQQPAPVAAQPAPVVAQPAPREPAPTPTQPAPTPAAPQRSAPATTQSAPTSPAPQKSEVVVIPTAPTNSTAAAETSWMSGRRIAGLTVLGVGVVSVVTGAVLCGMASSQYGNAADASTLGEFEAQSNSAYDKKVAGISTLVVGGVITGIGALVFLIPESKPQTAFWVAPAGNGVAVGGHF